MLRRSKKHQKKLAKLVLAALLFSGGVHGLMTPSVAEAAGSVTVTGYASGAFTPDGSMIVVPGSEYGYYKAYPDETGGSVNVLNLEPGEADTWESGNYVSVYGHNTTGAAASASGYTVNMAGAKAQVNYLYGSYAGVAHGANSEMAATASGNTVTVSEKAAVSSNVYGGSAYAYDYGSTVTAVKGTAANNEVTISGATVGKDVYGGYAYAYAENYYASNTNTAADASGNTVTISGAADIGGSVIGGQNAMNVYAYGYEAGTATAEGTAEASHNTVIISGSADSGVADIDGSVTGGSNTAYAYAYAEYGPATARENAKADSNTVTIGGADVGGAVYGGYNYNYAYSTYAYYNPVTVELTAGASENEVTISGAADSATVVGSGVYGGYNYNSVYYAYSYYEGGDVNVELTANADSNAVTISGAVDVNSDVYGGYNNNYAYYIYAYYGAINVGVTGSASENEVTITSDADVGGKVYGGYNYTKVDSVYSYYAGSEVNVELTAATDNNKVAIDGAAVGAVYGGYNYNEAHYVYPYDNGTTGDIKATATADSNTVTVKGASSVEGTVYGGYSPVTLEGYYGVSGITTIAAEGTASENVVTISEDGGEEVSVTESVFGGSASVYAYYGTTSTAEGTAGGNEVTISGKAAVGGTVYGGYAYAYSYAYDAASADHTAGATGDASNNMVTVSGNAVVSGGVFGGQDYSYAYAAGPGSGSSTDTAADAAAGTSHNTVTISGDAAVGRYLYGGEAYASAYAYYGAINTAGATAEASYNEVIISGNAVVDSGSGYYYTAVYGGEAYAGAYAYDGATNTAKATAGASHNTVTISDNAVIKTHNTASPYSYATIYGGVAYGYAYVEEGADNTAEGTSSAIENTVTISGKAAVGADATNAVMITGGIAYGNGAAKDNAVTISGGTVGTAENAKNNSIVGGAADGEASGNKVTIEGDATKVYAGAVIGGGHTTYYAYSAVAGAKAVGNNVTVSAEGAEIGLVYGGRSSLGDASENTVTLTAGSVTGNVNVSSSYGYYYGIAAAGVAAVAGGYTDKGDATLNTVEIRGITVSIPEDDGSGSSDTGSETVTSGSSSSGTPAIRITKAVVGGYAGTGNATGNTVKLTDATIIGGVYGGADKTGEAASAGDATGTGGDSGGESSAGDVVTGNTLVISGVNTVDGEVTNFETIKLADTVKWNTEAPVLKAGQFTDNADGTRAALDITDAQGQLGAGTSGRMTLLASETADDFATLTLITSEGKSDLSETNPYKSFLGAESSSTDKGVAVVSQEEQRIFLDTEDSYKNVYVSPAENRVKGISLDAMTWNTGRDLEGEYIFDNTITIDATNLAIGDVTTALKTNDSMTLVSNATGLTSANMVKNGSGRTVGIDYTDSGSGIKYAATASGNVTAGTGTVTYTVDSVAADKITLASRAWGAAADEMPETWKASASTQVDAAKFAYTGEATTALKKNDTATILNASGLTTASPVTDGADKTVAVNYTDTSGINFAATANGHVAAAKNAVNYVVDSVAVNSIDLAGWSGTVSAVTAGWTINSEGVKVDTETMKAPTDVAPGEEKPILSGGAAGTFKDEDIIGANAYKETAFTDASNPDDTSKGVVLEGTQGKGVKASDDGTGLVYATGKKEVSAVNAGVTDWQPGATLLDGSAGYDYTNVTSIDAGGFDVTFNKPEEIAAGESMTLLKANETLADMAAQEKSTNYSFEPVSGVTVDAAIAASLTVKNGIVTYTPSENKAGKLSFGDVLWNADKPLLTRPDNITFAGADVDTSKINFTNVLYLDANQEMTLVSGFGDSVGTITGGTYMVGTAFIGEGIASLSGSNLIFTTLTEAGLSEQTHKTVMAMDAGLAMLKTGNEFVGRAMDGLADVKNAGRDGISTFAAIGGGASRYNTGSHVNTHTWNAVVGVGKTSETKNGSMEWGVFGEYGKGSYTVHSAVGDGDGDAHYAGGGLLAKWTNKHDVYTEASVRAGRLSDSSSDIMQDSLGNKYGYNVHANYYGGHIGVGKIINYKGGRNLDVYGKFFYLKREGVEYDAPQQYNLDSVASSILRLGARYGTTDKKWNWYGGLAYEYEFDGEATGTVKGKEIRAASIKGSSVRGEFGMRMDATKTNPWSADISLYGYGGKHRGFGGNVSVMYTF